MKVWQRIIGVIFSLFMSWLLLTAFIAWPAPSPYSDDPAWVVSTNIFGHLLLIVTMIFFTILVGAFIFADHEKDEKDDPDNIREAYNEALKFALDGNCDQPTEFLRAWREGDTREWPEFKEKK